VSPYRGGWEPGDRFPPKTKQPAPKHGIKLKKIGASWWGVRWIEALERILGADSGRLSRGRTYARAGRTHDLIVKKSKVRALVTGSRPEPYEVSIALGSLPADTWQRVLTGMAAKAEFAAELLAGQMPKDLDEVFRAAGTSLFPRDRTDLVTSCSCPDNGDPCKHVAATHYVLGEALDQDPFLLFELRGRSKQQVLEALRALRTEPSESKNKRSKTTRKRAQPNDATARPALSHVEYDKAPEPAPTLELCFDAPQSRGALLKQLGTPASWRSEESPADSLSVLVQTAAERARAIAMRQDDPVAARHARSANIEPKRR
jgi:uncharacterized Zn finger protein